MEDTLCLTGGSDGNIRLWDLRVVEDYEDRLQRASEDRAHQDPLDRIAKHSNREEFNWEEEPSVSGITSSAQVEENGPCVRTLEGHSKSVTSLYYEDGCLVSPAHAHWRQAPVAMLTPCLGHRVFGQDDQTMGRSNWSMHPDYGYPMGHLQSTTPTSRTTSSTKTGP